MTDPGKISKKGRMTLELDGEGHYVTMTEGRGDPSKVGISAQITFDTSILQASYHSNLIIASFPGSPPMPMEGNMVINCL